MSKLKYKLINWQEGMIESWKHEEIIIQESCFGTYYCPAYGIDDGPHFTEEEVWDDEVWMCIGFLGIRDLKSLRDVPLNSKLTKEEQFIYNYGSYNCGYVTLKDESQVLKFLKEEYPQESLSDRQLKLIKEKSGKEVLAYFFSAYEDSVDVFIFPDDDIPFPLECFI